MTDECNIAHDKKANEAHIPLNEFPAILRWHDRLNELEAWREPLPDITVAA